MRASQSRGMHASQTKEGSIFDPKMTSAGQRNMSNAAPHRAPSKEPKASHRQMAPWTAPNPLHIRQNNRKKERLARTSSRSFATRKMTRHEKRPHFSIFGFAVSFFTNARHPKRRGSHGSDANSERYTEVSVLLIVINLYFRMK